MEEGGRPSQRPRKKCLSLHQQKDVLKPFFVQIRQFPEGIPVIAGLVGHLECGQHFKRDTRGTGERLFQRLRPQLRRGYPAYVSGQVTDMVLALSDQIFFTTSGNTGGSSADPRGAPGRRGYFRPTAGGTA